MFPSISIITPVFNRSSQLARAIASVRRQSVGDFEHIIIDDGSTDGSGDVAVSLGDSRLRLERCHGRQGANAARNRGIAMARAPIVTFLDSDDEFLPHRLEATLRIFEEDPETDLLLSSFTTRKGDKVRSSRNPDARVSPDLLERALVSHAIYIGGTSITVRRDTIVRCGGFAVEVSRMQDRELLLNITGHQGRQKRLGARLVEAIDWIKHVSTDSISAPVGGFVEALAELAACHPILLQRHATLVQYHVARRILAQLVRGRWRKAREVYSENLRAAAFGFGMRRLTAAYFQGRISRAKVFHDIHEVAAVAMVPSAANRRSGGGARAAA